jgi:hypothetical protein
MPPRKRSSSDRSAKDSNQPPDVPPDDGPPGRPPGLSRNPDADPVKIHREYVQRRLGGGALPTPEAYERALDEWHKIPGAVRGPAGEVHPDRTRGAGGELSADVTPEEPGPSERLLPATDPGENAPYENGAR